jgi:hypothetical protein
MVELPKKGEAGAGTGQPIVEGDNHMKKTFAVVAMAAVLGACAEGPMDPMDGPLFSKGVSDKVDLEAGFSIVTEGITVHEYVPAGEPSLKPGAGDKGTCDGQGTWNQSATENHQFCIISSETAPGTSIEITFSEWANYVTPKSGNFNLNFSSDCTYEYNEAGELIDVSCVGRFVHYQKNKNRTEGTGMIYGTGDDGSDWALNLGQINRAGDAEIAARRIGGLVANEIGGAGRTNATATMTW